MTKKQVMQVCTGTDENSLAQGLCHILLYTLTEAANAISECLMEAEADADGILSTASNAITFVQNNIDVIRVQIEDFEDVCAEIRKDVSKELKVSL